MAVAEKCLHVDYDAALRGDFDMSVPPATGEEYLMRVVHEAENCDKTVSATVDECKLKKQTFKVNGWNGCTPAPSGYAPSIEWQRHQVSHFSTVRRKLQCFVESKQMLRPPVRLPAVTDESGWWQLCGVGDNSSFHSKDGKTLDPCSVSGMDDASKDEEKSCGIPPLLSVVTVMSQFDVMQILGYHINWLQNYGFSIAQSCWIYALLAYLEKPISPDACSSLRDLARQCTILRASLDSAEHCHLVHLNLLICLVARYFEQSDLVDH